MKSIIVVKKKRVTQLNPLQLQALLCQMISFSSVHRDTRKKKRKTEIERGTKTPMWRKSEPGSQSKFKPVCNQCTTPKALP